MTLQGIANSAVELGFTKNHKTVCFILFCFCETQISLMSEIVTYLSCIVGVWIVSDLKNKVNFVKINLCTILHAW